MRRVGGAWVATLVLFAGCSSATESPSAESVSSVEMVPADDGGWNVTLRVDPGTTPDAAQDEVTSLLLSLLADGTIEGYSGGQGADTSTISVRIQSDDATITDVAGQLDLLDGVSLVGSPTEA